MARSQVIAPELSLSEQRVSNNSDSEQPENQPQNGGIKVTNWICGTKRIGRSILLWGEADARFPLHGIVGPHWPIILLTYGLILGISLVHFILIAFSLHLVIGAIGVLLLCATIFAYSATACSNPGIVLKDSNQSAEQAESNSNECGICKIKRAPGTQHCYFCETCCSELDHHCPWIGKCVGKENIFCFNVFVCLLAVLIVFVALTGLWKGYQHFANT
mmetsp:Transcript_2418/g.3417  ORF Transcript_2418/g.3417 Transcript_2418/m.3417 type:complete len:218 (+) Transcript_2418:80-733(+)